MAKKMALCFTYSELQQGQASVETLKLGLSGLSLSQCLHLFSAMNALLRHESEPVDMKAHNALVRWLFKEDVAHQILKSKRPALYRQQLLYMAKIALLACAGPQRGWKQEDFQSIGILCLMASDLLPTVPETTSANDLQRMVRYVLHFTPIQEAALHHTEHNITRVYLMLSETVDKLRDSKMFVDVKAIFERETSISIEDYFALMLGTLTRFVKFDEAAFGRDPKSYAITQSWFNSTKIAAEGVRKLLELLAATPAELASNAAKGDTGPADFTIFRNKPLVREEETFYPIDYELLAAKTEASVYWTVLKALPPNEQNNFQAFWGKVFERYIADLLESSANKTLNAVHPFVMQADDNNKELCDVVVRCADAMVLIECKGTMFRGDAKYQGDVDILEKEIIRKFVDDGKPTGVGQLGAAVRRIAENRECASDLTFRGITTVFPLLVIRDDIGGVVGLNRYLQLQFDALLPDRKKYGFSVAPLVCTSAEGLERWSSYLDAITLVKILHSHLQANKMVADILLKPACPLPPFMVGNAAIERLGDKPARLSSDWQKLIQRAIVRLGLKPE